MKLDKKRKKRSWFRFLPIVGDAALSFCLYSYLRSFPFVFELHSSLVKQSGLTQFYSEIVATWIIVLGSYLLLRFYTTIIFGVSISQFIFGLRGDSGFFWNRVGGGARVVLEVLTAPFFIFDILSFINGRRSLKELLSFTLVVHRGELMPLLATMSYIPLVLILSMFSPLLEDLTLLDGIKVRFYEEKKVKISHQTNFENFRSFSSNYYKFSSFSSLHDDRFVILPTFDIVRKGDKKKITPYFMIYDVKNSLVGVLRIVNRFRLLKLLDEGRAGNMLFPFKYRYLFHSLKEKREKFSMKQYDSKLGGRSLLSEKLKSNIEQLVRSSFELSYGNLWYHVFDNGPFIRGHVSVRNKFLKMLDEGAVPNIDISQMGNNRFLRVVQEFDHFSMNEKSNTVSKVIHGGDIWQRQVVETYIPIGTDNSMAIELAFEKKDSVNDTLGVFKKSFLSTIEWYFDYEKIFSMPKEKKDFGPFAIVDNYTDKNLTQVERHNLASYTYSYFYDIGKKYIESEDKKLLNLIVLEMDRLISITDYMNKRKGKKYSKLYIKQLQGLLVAIRNGSKEFFK